jgi:hypothetical protein
MSKGKYYVYVRPRLPEVEAWIRAGAAEKETARKLGIDYATFRRYKKQHAELADAIREAKVSSMAAVENSMYRMAVGFTEETTKPVKLHRVFYDEQGRRCEDEHVELVTIKEYVQPVFNAAAFLLTNYDPGRWRRNAGKEILDADKFEHEKKMDEEKTW